MLFGKRKREVFGAEAFIEALDRVQAIIWFDVSGSIVGANENFLAAIGYDEAEIVGKHHRMFVEPDYAGSSEYAQLWTRLAAGEKVTGEFKRIRKDGAEIWIEASYNPVLNDAGDVVGVVKFAIDITERLQEAAMSKYVTEAIGRSMAVIEFELDGAIRSANENFLGAVGYSIDEIRGRHHSMFCEEEFVSSPEYADLWAAMARGEYRSGVYKRVGNGGKIVWIRASYNPILDANGRPTKVIKFATNISEMINHIELTSAAVDRLSHGDLTTRLGPEVDGFFAPVREAFNRTVDKLGSTLGTIGNVIETMEGSITRIAGGGRDLSSRAEAQASSLEQTSATMEEMAASIKTNAESALDATGSATEATDRADRGGAVVTNAIHAMQEIETSSEKISDIIRVIDSISFQTNLLALNAAVEAARAGDAGKGFAVVASEVRTLAQRSADAAKDIANLIQESASNVEKGAGLVRSAGESLEEIKQSVDSVASRVGEISMASQEQASGVQEISVALNHMDEMTQRNSALAEQSASDATGLADQAAKLSQLIAFFKTAQHANLESDAA